MNRIGEQDGSAIKSVFSPDVLSPASKRERRDDAQQAGHTRPLSPNEDIPFEPRPLKYMGWAVARCQEASLSIFGEEMARQMAELESKIDSNSARTDALEARIKQLEERPTTAPDSPGIAQEIADIRRQVEAATLGAAEADVPYENRTLAIMGNLGFDTGADVLEQRCQALLHECGLGPEHFSGVASTRRESGSACEIVFASPQLLSQTRVKIKALRKTSQTRRTVWLDVKKTRSELKPGRMTHRVHEVLEIFEGERTGESQPVRKGCDVASF